MISKMNTDEDILDFLMTSDFEEEYKPNEVRYLLTKWRYFYRLLWGKLEMEKTISEKKDEIYNDELLKVKGNLLKSQIENANNENILNSIRSRKLTLKERLSGKIIIKNEDSRF